MAKLVEIEGIGETYAKKLEEAGVKTQEALLERGAQPKGRKELATNTSIPEKLILGWLNRADLARIKGVGEEYADLLELAGVDTVPELAQRNAKNLHTKMSEVNEAKRAVRSLPALTQVEGWVEQASKLDRKIHY